MEFILDVFKLGLGIALGLTFLGIIGYISILISFILRNDKEV